jgi:2-phosphoglycerate kinase
VRKKIIVVDEKHGLPYSKGIVAASIMATGVSPQEAYRVAEAIEERLLREKKYSVTVEDIRRLIFEMLQGEVGERYAQRYIEWLALQKLDKPLIILIGGTTGVGKSSLATEIAHRLGITRIVSTDAIREVMRAIFSPELVPPLHKSSFEAGRSLRLPVPSEANPLIIGFREQVTLVSLGIEAVVKRAILEGTSLVMEGIHIVPGFINFVPQYGEKAFIIPIVLSVGNENLHRSRFYIREIETEGERPFERYRRNFKNIRALGFYIEKLAREHGVSVIPCTELDKTVNDVLEIIFHSVFTSPEVVKRAKKVPIKLKKG